MKRAWGRHMLTIMPAASSISPSRPSGIDAPTSGDAPEVADLLPPILPGTMQFAVMPRSANSTAIALVSPTIPALAEQTWARSSGMAGHAADIQDRAAALFEHDGEDGAAHQKRTIENNGMDLPPFGKRHLQEGRLLSNGGVVDQNIDPTIGSLGLLDHARNIDLIGDIAHNDSRLLVECSHFVRHGFDLILCRTRGDDQISPMTSEAKSSRAADSPRSPGHQGHLSLQALHR